MTRILEICTFVRLSSNAQLLMELSLEARFPTRFDSNSFQIFRARKTSTVFPGLSTSADLNPPPPSWVEQPEDVTNVKEEGDEKA